MSLTKVSYSMIESAPVNVLDFGADPTGATDSLAAFQAAIASFPTTLDTTFYSQGGTVLVPPGEYFLSASLEINRNIVLKGVGSPYANATGLSQLIFADNINGIYVPYYPTSSTGKMGIGCTISSLFITKRTTSGTVGSAIYLNGTARIVNCSIIGFRENGITIVGNEALIPSTNANSWLIDSCSIQLCGGQGIYVSGPDANAGTAINTFCGSNAGWGIWDASFLGNTYVGCITQGNGAGSYNADSANGRSLFLGCYSEPDQPVPSVVPPNIMIGGLQGAGVNANTISSLFATGQGLNVTGEFNVASNMYLGSLTGLGLNRQGNMLAINTASGNGGASNGLSIGIQGRASDNGSQVTFYNSDGLTQNSYLGVNNTAAYYGTAIAIPLDFFTNNVARIRIDASGNLLPIADDAYTLGGASNRWTTVYATTPTISTSDAREKQQVLTITDQERAVAVRLKHLIRSFKFNEAVERKGDNARIHFGVIAQEVKVAFEAEGLVAEKYAIFCYDEWNKTPAVEAILDESGNEIFPAQPERLAGNRYGVRYEELLAFIIAAL
jgi:hypothetical protein